MEVAPKKEVVWTRSHVSLIAKERSRFRTFGPSQRRRTPLLDGEIVQPGKYLQVSWRTKRKTEPSVGVWPRRASFTQKSKKKAYKGLYHFYNTVLQRWRKLWKGKRHKKINNGCTLGLLSSNNLSCIFIAEWSDGLVVKAGAVGAQCFHPGMRETLAVLFQKGGRSSEPAKLWARWQHLAQFLW